MGFLQLGRRPRVASITGAQPSLSEDIRGRQRRYVIAMAVRTVCVVLAAVCWQRFPLPAAVFLAGGVVIPYVAMIAANAGRQRRPVAEPYVPVDSQPQSGGVERVIVPT